MPFHKKRIKVDNSEYKDNTIMQQKVQNYIQKHQLLEPEGLIIVGVSGGTDSVVLLHVLMALGYSCVIAHCNFHLRMEESDRDEEFVRNLSKELKLPFYKIDFETVKYAEEHKISIEMAARDLRYAWFEELLIKLRAQAIAIAHQADDSIETMLMNLVRGTGLRGLTGIQPRNKNVVRPLLFLTRQDLETYLVRYNLGHVEDSTNSISDYQRNKFRNQILPLLEEINPSVRQTLYTSLERFDGSLAIYEHAVNEIIKKAVQKENDIIKIDIEVIKNQVHIPTVMYELMYPYGFTPAVIEQITNQLDGESGKLFFSDSFRLLKDRKFLIINALELISKELFWISKDDTEIDKPLSMKFLKKQFSADFNISREKNCIHIDYSLLTFPLKLRRWKEGDTFFPFGMKKHKKISDFFIDNKFSLLQKEQTWILESGNDIVWITGERMDDRFRVTENTEYVLEVKVVQ